jgi:hypothetical protein
VSATHFFPLDSVEDYFSIPSTAQYPRQLGKNKKRHKNTPFWNGPVQGRIGLPLPVPCHHSDKLEPTHLYRLRALPIPPRLRRIHFLEAHHAFGLTTLSSHLPKVFEVI